MSSVFPASLTALLCEPTNAEEFFPALLATLGQELSCDRCFIYFRNPKTSLGRVPFCWTRTAEIAIVHDADWKPEPPELASDDPMFAAALNLAPAIFVNDVETATPDVLNREFERENFGHRALIHAHLCYAEQLWGVLQPAVFGQPRLWTQRDRRLIEDVVQAVSPIVVRYAQQHQTRTT